MIIYPQEQADGIAELVQSKASINYDMPILTTRIGNYDFNIELLKSQADLKFKRDSDTFDLHPIHSVLVSMGCNKNDDIFTREQAWPARNSPENKPFNFMHNQADIIGHITESFVVDEAFAKIEDGVDSSILPNKFHIITAGVIYKVWEDPKLQTRMDKIIAEIKEGDKWFVSMECLFAGFDYGIIKANGESAIIERNESTSALTKYLRAYGGPGVYNGHKIGRVLKQITFSGKGLVNNPANPESVILNNFNSTYANLGYVNSMNQNGENNMTDTVEVLKAELKETKDKLSAKEIAAVDALNKSHASEIKSLSDALESYKKNVADLTAAKDKEDEEKEDKKKFWEKDKAELEKLKADNEYMNKVITEFKKASKKSSLVEAGVEATEAEKLVENTSALNDEAFASLVSVFAKKKEKDEASVPMTRQNNNPTSVAKEEKEEKKEMKEDCEAGTKTVTVDPANVITTATEEAHANLGVSVSNEQTETAKAIAEYFKSFKGETK